MGIPVFFIVPTDRERVALRRYRDSAKGACPARGYHGAVMPIGERQADDGASSPYLADRAAAMAYDTRWPTVCECGEPFADDDHWQEFTDRIYRRTDTGEEMVLRDAPVGACWNATWFVDKRVAGFHVGPDGRCLVVRLPGNHDWVIDSRAANCTMPDDNVHKCWVRHGSPEDGTLHVDKAGNTCSAGAGSIDTGSWHGFLHHGQLVT